MEIFLFLVAVILLVSWLYRADLDRITEDYERWKNRRK
jgi:hypothetical protein